MFSVVSVSLFAEVDTWDPLPHKDPPTPPELFRLVNLATYWQAGVTLWLYYVLHTSIRRKTLSHTFGWKALLFIVMALVGEFT